MHLNHNAYSTMQNTNHTSTKGMLILTYGSPGRGSIPWLAGMACYYTFYDHTLSMRIDHDIEDTLYSVDAGEERILFRHVRVPELDSPPDVANRTAYTTINIRHFQYYKRDPIYNIMLFRQTLKVIRHLRDCENQGISKETVDMIEKVIWERAGIVGKRLHSMARRLFNHIMVGLSTKYLTPDYVWKTGKYAGKTTIERFRHNWEKHISYATPHTVT